MESPTEGMGDITMSDFTKGDYQHIKENGFNPKICTECREIDMSLINLPDTYVAMYEAIRITLEDYRDKRAGTQLPVSTHTFLLNAKAKADGG